MAQPDGNHLLRSADARRRRVEAMKLETPGFRLRERLGSVRPGGRLERPLRRAAPADPLRLLCGIRVVPPGDGGSRPGLDPAARAQLYEAGGAAGLSIATGPDSPQDDLAWVSAAREATNLPLLVEDFVVDEYQLLDTAVRGGDGVLLMAALCSDVQLQVLASKARMLGLDPLVEVHDHDELQRALRAGSTLVALGRRGPGATQSDLAIALELLPAVPPLVTAVAWSDIATPGDLARLRDTRCDAVHVGEALAASPDPAATLATLAAAANG